MPLSSSVILAHAVDRGANRRLQAAKNLPGKKARVKPCDRNANHI